MDFGRVPADTLMDIDFKLPAEPVFNKKVLKGKPVKKPEAWLGCAKWGRKEWIGKIYPKGTKEANFLGEYVKTFQQHRAECHPLPDLWPRHHFQMGRQGPGDDL